jgi:hypothetical protein
MARVWVNPHMDRRGRSVGGHWRQIGSKRPMAPSRHVPRTAMAPKMRKGTAVRPSLPHGVARRESGGLLVRHSRNQARRGRARDVRAVALRQRNKRTAARRDRLARSGRRRTMRTK